MSKYTTGEIARLCDVTVRTVQYYDKRGILVPSELSEGGRRIYSEDDLKRMKIICFLRDLDMSIDSIGELMKEEHPQNVISILLEQQEQSLRSEISERQAKLDALAELKKSVKDTENFSFESIGDVAYQMKNKKKLRKIRGVILTAGIIIDIIEVATIALWAAKGIWMPFVLGLCIMIPLGIWATIYYMNHVAYICPECHEVFQPSKKEMFFALHTPTTRKLTCPCCGHKGYCVEVAAPEEAKEAEA
ncbi:MAG: MerR family transcriptional regulator [Ruminococcus sp.]|nr:MerR family transcriptional regulator [Ruminococcus sp.]